MSISHFLNRIKSHIDPAPESGDIVHFDTEGRIISRSILDKVFLTALIVLVSLLSFGVGRLTSEGEREAVRIEYNSEIPNSQTANALNAVQEGSVVASKNGSKYHYPHCPGAKQIAEKNKITFATVTAAEGAGYTLAGNCKPR